MKKARIAAVKAVRQSGAFLLLHEHEAAVLDALPGWAYRLFLALLRASNFNSGQGDTTYSNLERAMRPIQPRSGPRHFVPDLQAIKKLVRQLEERRILSRDKLHSQDQGRLLFMVAPRYAEARPLPKLEPLTRTPVDSVEPSIHAGSEATEGGTRTPNSNPSSGGKKLHIGRDELSTGGALRPPEPTSPPGPIELGREGGKIGPPRGPDHRPLRGHAPQGDTPTQARMRARVNSAPPGGQDDAPQGDSGAPVPPSARIRRPRKPVLSEGGLPNDEH